MAHAFFAIGDITVSYYDTSVLLFDSPDDGVLFSFVEGADRVDFDLFLENEQNLFDCLQPLNRNGSGSVIAGVTILGREQITFNFLSNKAVVDQLKLFVDSIGQNYFYVIDYINGRLFRVLFYGEQPIVATNIADNHYELTVNVEKA